MVAYGMVALAAGVGVILAALDGPRAEERRWAERFSVVILTVGAATIVAAVAQEMLG